MYAEPRSALVADENGMADLTHIIDNARQMLTFGGFLLLETRLAAGRSGKSGFQAVWLPDVETS